MADSISTSNDSTNLIGSSDSLSSPPQNDAGSSRASSGASSHPVIPITSGANARAAKRNAVSSALRTTPSWAIQAAVLRHLEEGNHYATDESGVLLYRYDPARNIYIPDADTWVKDEMARFLGRQQWSGYWTVGMVRNVLSHLRANRLHIPRRPPAGRINLLNGVLDLESGVLSPPTPLDPWVIQIPHRYDAAATCPEWTDWYLPSMFSADVIPLALEMFGACMTSDKIAEMSIWLIANGSNGKSTFFGLLERFLGEANVSHLSVMDIHKGGFKLHGLEGKLLNVDLDATHAVLKDPTNLKKIISGDPILVDVKYREPYTMYPFCKCFFASQNPPRSNDGSQGWERRQLFVSMSNRQFSAEAGTTLTWSEIESRLCTSSEFSGLLNLAIAGWQRFRSQRRFSIPEEVQGYTTEQRELTNWFRGFLENYVTWDEATAKICRTPIWLPTQILQIQANHFAKVLQPEIDAKITTTALAAELERRWPGSTTFKRQERWRNGPIMRGFSGLACSYTEEIEQIQQIAHLHDTI